MSDVFFPKMTGDGAESGVLATWYVADGEQVKAEQLLAEVALDKVDAEVLAPGDGVVRLVVEEGAEVAQGALIARLE